MRLTNASRRDADIKDSLPVSRSTTPVDGQLCWLLDLLRDGAQKLTPEVVTERFTSRFLDLVPPEGVVESIQQFSASLGDFSFEGFTRQPTDLQAILLLTAADSSTWVVPIAVESDAPHRITGVAFNPVPVPEGVPLFPSFAPDGSTIEGQSRMDGVYDIVGGRQMYLSSVGDGGPTVILDSGLGDSAAAWFGIESAVSGFTRVVTYDRAGSIGGASDPAGSPRVASDVVADLRALLIAAGIPGPYVLVGHSIGGVFSRVFAHTWPEDVAGLVLVDSSHDDQIARIREIVPTELWTQMERFMVPAPSLTPEGVDVPAVLDEVRADRDSGSLPNVPLAVISAGVGRDPAVFPKGWPIEEDHVLWLQMQADLATLIPGGRHVIAEKSGHYVHQTEPELVIEAIRQVVQAVREPGSWDQ
jgi:pimeloyl-ACP methyl ester carboxylesterase